MMGGSICNKLFAVAIIGVLCLIHPISAAVLGLTSPLGPSHKCPTKECRIERLDKASEILEYRDENVDPCDNFFRHVCGNWKETPFTSPAIAHAMRESIIEEMIEQAPEAGESKAHQLVHDFYKVCMDNSARGEKAFELFKGMVFDFWPPSAADKWNEAEFDWIDWVGEAKQVGFTVIPFIDWEPQEGDETNTLKYRLKMPTSLFHFKPSDFDDEQNEVYKDYMLVAARLFGSTDENSEKELTPAYEFEKKLYGITSKPSSDEEKDMTIEEMQKEFPGIDWAKFVEKTLKPFLDADHTPILTVPNPTALKEFIKLMESTPKRVQATFAYWKGFQYSMPYLTEEYKEAHKIFLEKLDFPEMKQDEFCDEMTKNFAAFAIEDLYLNQFGTTKVTIDNMFKTIKEKMIEMIKESKVLTEDAKKEGVEIMEKMDYTIGRVEKFSDQSELDEFYADANITMDNFLQTLFDMNLFQLKKENSKKIQDEISHHTSVPHSGHGLPFIDIRHLYIPLSMIPSPAFNNELPMYVNFGAAGSHMAREMFVPLLDVGKPWAEQKATPNDQLNCFKTFGQNISFPEMKEAFEEEIVEDIIAQWIGFRAAYAAYKQYTAETGPDLGLPELSYTPDQLFWVSFAQTMCRARAAEDDIPLPFANKNFNLIDFMANLMINNIPEMAEAFDCPVGSAMNPEHRCTWW